MGGRGLTFCITYAIATNVIGTLCSFATTSKTFDTCASRPDVNVGVLRPSFLGGESGDWKYPICCSIRTTPHDTSEQVKKLHLPLPKTPQGITAMPSSRHMGMISRSMSLTAALKRPWYTLKGRSPCSRA
jgi:hypothetical protein